MGKDRQFPIDMAGFAVNIQLLFTHPEAQFSLEAKRGHLESSLLSGLITINDLQPLADDCVKVCIYFVYLIKDLLFHVTLSM